MGFLKDNDGSGMTVRQGFGLRCATKLMNALRKHSLLTRDVKLPRWSTQFIKLAEHHDRKEIEEVLAWYVENLGADYLPEACSAGAFCKRYRDIRDYAGIAGSEITEDAKKIASRLAQEEWPAHIRRQLPSIVQKSINNYAIYAAKIRAARQWLATNMPVFGDDNYGKHLRMCNLLNWTLENRYLTLNPVIFVEGWFWSILEVTANWRNWEPSPKSITFTDHSPWLRRFMDGWAYGYTGNSMAWDNLHYLILRQKVKDHR